VGLMASSLPDVQEVLFRRQLGHARVLLENATAANKLLGDLWRLNLPEIRRVKEVPPDIWIPTMMLLTQIRTALDWCAFAVRLRYETTPYNRNIVYFPGPVEPANLTEAKKKFEKAFPGLASGNPALHAFLVSFLDRSVGDFRWLEGIVDLSNHVKHKAPLDHQLHMVTEELVDTSDGATVRTQVTAWASVTTDSGTRRVLTEAIFAALEGARAVLAEVDRLVTKSVPATSATSGP
jgi:hypothetical protein